MISPVTGKETGKMSGEPKRGGEIRVEAIKKLHNLNWIGS